MRGADILIENAANGFDRFCNLCIAVVGIAAQECGVSVHLGIHNRTGNMDRATYCIRDFFAER